MIQVDLLYITKVERQCKKDEASGDPPNGAHVHLHLILSVKRPGPPSAVRTRVHKHAIVVSWQPPIERTLPITSYIVNYEILPDGHAYRIIVAPVMTSFPINTDRWLGKLLRFNVTAMIQDLEGETSPMAYARAG